MFAYYFMFITVLIAGLSQSPLTDLSSLSFIPFIQT